MKIALVFGGKGEVIKERLCGVKDNLSVDSFNDIDSLISASIYGNKFYDRILVLASIARVEEGSIQELLGYWKDNCPRTEIVLIGRKRTDESFAANFTAEFSSPLCVPMLLSNTTLPILVEASVENTQVLNKKYGLVVASDVEVDEDIMQLPEETVDTPTEEDPVESTITEVTNEVQQETAPQVKTKKGGFFSGLFGRKNTPIPSAMVETNQMQVSPQGETPMTVVEDLVSENIANLDNSQVIGNTANSSMSETDYSESVNVTTNDANLQEVADSTIEEPLSSIEYGLGSSGVLDEFPEVNVGELSPQAIPDISTSFESLVVEDAEIPDTMETVGEETPIDLDEVDLDFGDLDVADSEGEYRADIEESKVIVKEVVKKVVKEVVKEVPVETKVKSNILDSVYEGKVKKVILVTGDRGSGVTSLACDIAFELAEKVPTLYFDVDTDTHGLLNYIDYFDFRNYSDACMQGLKVCKSKRGFSNCAIRFDDNLDLLTTNFGVEVTDDEIDTAQSVVAEVSNNYGVVVVDAPIDKLPLLTELLPLSCILVTVEASKRGIMNFICKISDSPLQQRFKRILAGKGLRVLTKASNTFDLDDVEDYVNHIVDFDDDINWLELESVMRPDKIDEDFLEVVVER